jgi:LuxR family maltose regulon positive regulatory protein
MRRVAVDSPVRVRQNATDGARAYNFLSTCPSLPVMSESALPSTADPVLERGSQALRAHDWAGARALFRRALDIAVSPQALEGLALAAWWQDDRSLGIEAREQSYRLYREGGDARSAARVALWLSYGSFRGEPAISNGWLERARRLLEAVPPCEEHCWALYREALRALRAQDSAAVLRLCREAMTIARSIGCIDMEMLAMSLEGATLVGCGDVDAGMHHLDEVAAAIVAGEMSNRWATGVATCNLIGGCEQVRDYERASEWCARLKELSLRWRHPPAFAVCRALYAEVLLWRGQWADAETELTHAIGEFDKLNMPMKTQAVAALAELRRRQGRIDEARQLASQAELHPAAALVCAEIALEEGQPQHAVETAERYLRRVAADSCTEVGAGLETLVRAHMALGDTERAAQRAEELKALCSRMATRPGRATCERVSGWLAQMRGDFDRARRHLEDAVALFTESGAPYEAARSRLALAQALAAGGRSDASREEARRALEQMNALGARTQAQVAQRFLEGLDAPAQPLPHEGDPLLSAITRREQQVLQLIAHGLTNHEIAERLFLSEHTVHRHVANILAKLDLPSRAAAAAFAAGHRLV